MSGTGTFNYGTLKWNQTLQRSIQKKNSLTNLTLIDRELSPARMSPTPIQKNLPVMKAEQPNKWYLVGSDHFQEKPKSCDEFIVKLNDCATDGEDVINE